MRSLRFRLIALGALIIMVLALCGSALASRGLTGAGLFTLARYLRAPSQTTSTPTLLRSECLLREAVLWNPTNALAHRGLGLALAAEGREKEAMAAWQAAEGMPEELIQRGEQAREAKMYEEALRWYERAIVLEPGLGDAWYYTGLVHEELEQWGRTIEAYEQAIKVGTLERVAKSSPYRRLGIVYLWGLDRPRLDEALAAYNTAIALDDFETDSEAAGVYQSRGVVYNRQGRDPRESIQEYQRALTLDPEHRWAHLRLGQATYQAYGDVSLAEQEIEKALALWPDNESRKWPYLILGNVYRDAGLTEEAIAAYEEALRLDPSDDRVQGALENLTGPTDD